MSPKFLSKGETSIISRVVQDCTIELFIRLLQYALYSISKALIKSCKANKGVEQSFSFNKLNALSCSISHLKSNDFLNNLS